ncbi:MAG: hypothetical protein A3A32_03460 [Candidatus Wildermuthbacteria bacterium RIFCSPLOWO2_01_FULL_48_35]|uniref:Uncharacterized protein n=2 Tax=Parcubacteria group TaxID=1794811 RepID=A0A1G2RPU0_9BACT|nr:MAG: hypothetical protein UX72_C0003G0073 [Parcubacteria group bacterium GW2011_GWA2_47_10]OGZ94005.1 MAG: hypothetical protein A2633_01015 [Candidatus Sungbacteria bacterium RIFCSPHIGHO2_01_FULL_47_32]OHA74880.1 MAG: hypothetical protein A3A32_03460 [Candidatus Wildermuthbacteria bacterium RIFCSPLOWO2_01_FULL_48_35]
MDQPQSKIEKLREEGENIKQALREQVFGYILGAFGLVAGLAWNDAIRSLIEYLFPLSQNTLWAKFFYAFVITASVVLVGMYFSRLFKKGDEKL